MNIFLALAFGSLFVGTTGVLLASFVLFFNNQPWILDQHATLSYLIRSQNYQDLTQWMNSIPPPYNSEVANLINSLYLYCTTMTIFCCLVVLMVTFLANKNRPLMTSVLTLNLFFLSTFAYYYYQLNPEHALRSQHSRLMLSLLATNGIGYIAYMIDLLLRKPPPPQPSPRQEPSILERQSAPTEGAVAKLTIDNDTSQDKSTKKTPTRESQRKQKTSKENEEIKKQEKESEEKKREEIEREREEREKEQREKEEREKEERQRKEREEREQQESEERNRQEREEREQKEREEKEREEKEREREEREKEAIKPQDKAKPKKRAKKSA